MNPDFHNLLERLDLSVDPLSEDSVEAQLLKVYRSFDAEAHEPPFEVQTEWLAFRLRPDQGTRHGWDTYYGPIGSRRSETGEEIEFPSRSSITSQAIEYWRSRIHANQQPVLTIRYADLIWDFAKCVTGKGADVSVARTLIDATIKLVKTRSHRREIQAIERLGRAISVALSLRDTTRVRQLIESTIDYERVIGDDSKPGLWGFSFDLLVNNRGVDLPSEVEKRIVLDLEERLSRIASRAAEVDFNVHSADRAMSLLLSYYKRHDRKDDARRVLVVYRDACVLGARERPPLAAAIQLRAVSLLLHQEGLRKEAGEIEPLLREIQKQSLKELQPISVPMEVDKQQLESFLSEMVEGGLEECLLRMGAHFVPDLQQLGRQAVELGREFTSHSIFPMMILDTEGRETATIGPIESDLPGRVVFQVRQELEFRAPFLRACLSRMVEVHDPTVAQLVDHLYRSPIFPEVGKLFLARGIEAYLRKDYAPCITILIPEIERAIRELVQQATGRIYQRNRYGFLQLRTLDDLLRESSLRSALSTRGEDVFTYLRVLLTDQRGWNLRNVFCHGMATPGYVGISYADRVIHALLLLALIEDRDKEESEDQRTAE